MGLLVQAWLLDKYGPRLTVDQLGEVLTIEPRTIYNQISSNSFPVPTYKDGNRRFADFRDVASHLDALRPPVKDAA